MTECWVRKGFVGSLIGLTLLTTVSIFGGLASQFLSTQGPFKWTICSWSSTRATTFVRQPTDEAWHSASAFRWALLRVQNVLSRHPASLLWDFGSSWWAVPFRWNAASVILLLSTFWQVLSQQVRPSLWLSLRAYLLGTLGWSCESGLWKLEGVKICLKKCSKGMAHRRKAIIR